MSVAALAALTLVPILVSRMAAPANHGGHGLTTGFGRGRLDLAGIVSEGSGASVDLPDEPSILTLRLSGDGPIRLVGAGVDRTILGTKTPARVRLNLSVGGRVRIESSSRIRLHDLVIERVHRPLLQAGVVAALGLLAVFFAWRGLRPALISAFLLFVAFLGTTSGTLSGTFTRIAVAQLVPALVIAVVLVPLVLALKAARFPRPRQVSRLALAAFVSSLTLTGVQLIWFEQPLPLGDPAAYFEMGGRFADALVQMGSPFNLGPILAEIRPYLALPATGLLYGLFRLLSSGLGLIYVAQAMAMATAVSALVSICETEIGSRAAKVALVIALLHPSFSILPGIVQPEPFILAAWTVAALLALRTLGHDRDPRALLGAGIAIGVGLALHPQGLSFLLLALALWVLPWIPLLSKRPVLVIAPVLGAMSALLPVAAAAHFAKPLAYVLDKQYGFFAYTSPHPLGFWLYLDSDGWQGPLRIEDTTYQKELMAMKGEGGLSSTFGDVALFVSRHPVESGRTVLTNLHRLWHQPDNPFAAPFVLPYGVQVPFHRGLVVLFVLSLPALFGGRLAILALPFVMLSMTYPAYHVFNKYATPALPFTIIGASLVMDRLARDRVRTRILLAGLLCAGVGALLPAVTFARIGVPGDLFLAVVRGLLWIGLSVALVKAIQTWGVDARSRVLAAFIGFTVLICSSVVASRNDTTRGTWSASLDRPLEVSCRLSPASRPSGALASLDPAWILLDSEVGGVAPPRIEVNGHVLEALAPTMPTFGLASLRGRRDPATFRQIWRTPVSEQDLAAGELKMRVSGGPEIRVFGDIRGGSLGPRLSPGNWPYLSVYRLMHEGQYRLPTTEAPAQACVASGLSGRPGLALMRIPKGEENQIALKSAKPPTWTF